jgi:hypothetical protein
MSARRVFVCSAILLAAQVASAQTTAFDLGPGQRVLSPVQFKQLALFPIVLSVAGGVDKTQFITLRDGLASKQVSVSEAKGGATVNQVTIANHAAKPLLLLAGEVILGGQQDRILGKDTVVAPGEEMQLQVFCVEHGRWSGHSQFTSTGGMVEGKARAKAKFADDQSGVWSEVAKKTGALKAETATGTYRSIATGAKGEEAVKPYREHVTKALDALPDGKKMIGFIAAVNGRVSSVERFADPQVFASYRDRLLDALYVSVADVPVADKVSLPAKKDIDGFMQQAEAAPAEAVMDNRSATTTQNKTGAVKKSKLMLKSAPPSAKPVYESYQAD